MLTAAALTVFAAGLLAHPAVAAPCTVAALADVAGRADHTVGAAGNARMIAARPGVVKIAAVGDLAYESGTAAEFRNYWRPHFGTLEHLVFAAAGNHEARTAGFAGLEAELGDRADSNRGSTVCGTWRLVSLNPYRGTTRAVDFLRAERVRFPDRHLLAVWHPPAYSSGSHGGSATGRALQDAAQSVGALVVVNGHDHDYERFAPKGPTRQFVSGLGGHEARPFGAAKTGSQARYTGRPGTLFLELAPSGSYAWEFRTIDGTVRDAGRS